MTGTHHYRDGFVKWSMRVLSSLCLCAVLVVLYWLVLDRSPPAEVKGGEVIHYEPQWDGSWVMFVKWHGIRHRYCWGNSKRWLSHEAILPLEDIAYPPSPQNKNLGPYEWEVPVFVPSYFARTGHSSGTYSIRILYACNPLQEYIFPIVVEPPPVPFDLPVDRRNQGPTEP